MTTPTNKSSGLLADSSTLNSLINEAKIAGHVEVIPEVDSTQKVLLEREADSLVPGLTLVTFHQTAGIGRLGRTWETAPGDAVLMSFVFQSDSTLLPLFTGNAIAKVIGGYLPAAKLKWPNDLVVEVDGKTRKLGGIVLQRHASDPKIVVAGIGINLKFSDSRPTEDAIALNELVAELPDINKLIFEIVRELGTAGNAIIENYKERCLTIGKDVFVQMLNSPDVTGRAIDINQDGGLVVETENGRVDVLTGDVKHLRTSE